MYEGQNILDTARMGNLISCTAMCYGKPRMAKCTCFNGFSWRSVLLIMMTTVTMVVMTMVMMTMMMMMVAIVTELPGAA